MMQITLIIPASLSGKADREEELEVLNPDLPVSQFVEAIRRELGLPPGGYLLRDAASGRELPMNVSLRQAGVETGDALTLAGNTAAAPVGLRRATLRAEDGREFVIRGAAAVIGRPRSGASERVDIDLTPVDPGKTVSRPHAQVIQREGRFYLKNYCPTNGTFLNGQQLADDEERPVKDGDQVRLGQVALIFHLGEM